MICTIGPFTVYSYGLTLVAAFLIASALARQEAKRQRINPEIIFNLVFLAFISGIIGARLFYIVENLKYYLENPLEIIMLQLGGLSWFGGLFSAVICGIVYLKNKKLSVYKIFDLIAPFVALAQGIGRVGCYLNGCCFGKTALPIQIYSSLTLIFIFIILRFLQARPHKEGQIFFSYLLLYSLKRFFIEFWRLDNKIIFLDLTLFQIISILVFSFSLLELFLIKKSTESSIK